MLLVEIARPPGDFRTMAGELGYMLAGAAAGFQHVAGFSGKELLQHRPDRLMVAVKRRRVEPTAGFDRPSILAEFHDIFSHLTLFTSNRRSKCRYCWADNERRGDTLRATRCEGWKRAARPLAQHACGIQARGRKQSAGQARVSRAGCRTDRQPHARRETRQRRT